MIKTVSFAPPRSARAAAKPAGKSASKPAKVQPARAVATAAVADKPAKTQPARATSGSSLAPRTEENAVAPRRRAAQNSNLALDFEVAPTEVETKATAPKKTRAAKTAPAPVASTTAATAPATVAPAAKISTKSRAAETAEVAQIEDVVAEPEKAPLETKVAPKIKRSRAPKDLALQYGGAATEDVPRPVAEKPTPRKRLTREAKAARSQMLRPDDDVLQRLQQANAVEVKKTASRGRGWEFECGRCGRVSRFQTPAAICACGAIAVKE